ncbi:ThuA domain-containing protein [Thermostilla marina]
MAGRGGLVRWWVLLIFWSSITGVATAEFNGSPDSPVGEATGVKRILLVTGEDYPGHKWQETAPVLAKAIGDDKRLQVEIAWKTTALASEDLGRFDGVVLHFKNYDPEEPGPKAQENLERFVADGGGLVLVHFACGAFQEWPRFERLAGRVWDPQLRGHDPHGPFVVRIVDGDHPIVRGMKDFETVDELYTCLAGKTPIHVLASATSRVDGKAYPMAFVLEYGKGRVFHSPLGHDVKALSVPEVAELFRRGTAWTVGLDP